MPITLDFAVIANVRETLALGVDAVAQPTLVHNGFSVRGHHDAESLYPVSQCAAWRVALADNEATIDLTDLTAINGAPLDATGLKLRLLVVHNGRSVGGTLFADNEGALTLSPGVVSGYAPFGAAQSLTLPVGASLALHLADGAPTVGSSARLIDCTGSGTDQFDLLLVFG